ncbi:hypothetical protein [Anaerococcus sp. Marseille-P3915]|uniref:hypothetical protein n=1 Tax=Anaerococcus sp. Marseille-P3915 TaxID=2057799 RepID=UPI000D0AD33B|nr:hypothetical protein [Anaerococcus sp. Marseille-P3915]
MDNFKRFQVENYREDFIHIDQIKWDGEGLKNNLEAEKNHIKINLIFADIVYLYSNTLELYKPSWWIGKEGDYYPFYYAEDSEYISKLKKEVDHIKDNKIIHFVIIGVDNVVDVLTSDFPKTNIR